MRGQLTEYAQAALEELSRLWHVCGELAHDIKREEDKLAAHNKRRPKLPPVTNEPFNKATARFLGILQLCRAVDIYNWYWRGSYKWAVKTNPSVVDLLRTAETRIADKIRSADKQLQNPADAVTDLLNSKWSGEWAVRDAVHKHLDVTQDPETELICVCRNILVHRRGFDELGQVAQEIKKLGSSRADIYPVDYPAGHMPICLSEDGQLVINDEIGRWACRFLENQIHLMDQSFAYMHKLPTKRWRPRPLGRKWIGGSR